MPTYLVTGGAGFIGANLVRRLLEQPGSRVVVYDALTYAGSRENLDGTSCELVEADVTDREALRRTLSDAPPSVIFHLASESHVDRSIDAPYRFVRTNVVGTFELCEALRNACPSARLVHVSTDEVYGSQPDGVHADERSAYAPSSPYAASKAAADHLVRAYVTTYGLDAAVVHLSNCYGPFQYPEKLVPLTLFNALEERPLPVYGDGHHKRDWLHVSDACTALVRIADTAASTGTSPLNVYNVGGSNERTTLEVVHALCDALDALHPRAGSYRELVTFVADRPGHDRRYAMETTATRAALAWQPVVPFEQGIADTVSWYLNAPEWRERMARTGVHRTRRGATSGS